MKVENLELLAEVQKKVDNLIQSQIIARNLGEYENVDKYELQIRNLLLHMKDLKKLE